MRGIAKRETCLLDGNLCNNSIFNAACDGAVVGRRARRHVAVLLRDHRVREHTGDLVGLVNSSNVVPEKDGKEKDPDKEDSEEDEY